MFFEKTTQCGRMSSSLKKKYGLIRNEIGQPTEELCIVESTTFDLPEWAFELNALHLFRRYDIEQPGKYFTHTCHQSRSHNDLNGHVRLPLSGCSALLGGTGEYGTTLSRK